MTGLVRKATILGVCGLFAAASALANVPSPGNSTIPAWIPVVGFKAANVPHPDSPVTGVKSVTITVRDFTSNPVSGSDVELDFSGCADVQVCSFQAGGAAVVCPSNKVHATTNAAGQVTFTVIGAGNTSNGTQAAGCGLDGVVIRASTIPLGNASAWVYDTNGALASPGGVDTGDLAVAAADVNNILLQNYGVGTSYRARRDYNTDSTVNNGDLSVLSAAVSESNLNNGSGAGCIDGGGAAAPYCP